ncbi:hypothetical protein Tco_0460896 [Tanacetum coccineum]
MKKKQVSIEKSVQKEEAEARKKAATEEIRRKNLEEARASCDMKKNIQKNEYIQPKTGSSGIVEGSSLGSEAKDETDSEPPEKEPAHAKNSKSGSSLGKTSNYFREFKVQEENSEEKEATNSEPSEKEPAHVKNFESEAVVWELMDLGKSFGEGSSSESKEVVWELMDLEKSYGEGSSLGKSS